MRFQDKVAVITASASGIGKAIAKIMAGEGAQLVAVDISAPDLATVAEELEAAGGNVTTMQVDVLDAQQVEGMVDSIVNRFSRIDILVNAVGGSTTIVDAEGMKSALIPHKQAFMEDLTLEEWDKVIQFNLNGTFLCAKAAVQQMKKQGGGKIVNLSSRAGHGLSDSSSAYVAAKAGIMAFTKKVAIEAGPYGITCNAIAPGRTLSDRLVGIWEQMSEQDQQRFVEDIPLRRVAQPEDQAKVIAFLASADADYVTGVTIDMSGGR